MRVRLTFPGRTIGFPPFDDSVDFLGAYEHRILRGCSGSIRSGIRFHCGEISSVGGERYEMESEVDVTVADQILRRSANVILKNRHSLWYDEDGWEFDVSAGQNEGLIVAECERLAPVVDLRIPEFCVTEVTEDLRFTNDCSS